ACRRERAMRSWSLPSWEPSYSRRSRALRARRNARPELTRVNVARMTRVLLVCLLVGVASAQPYPSEIPPKLTPARDDYDHVRREVEIPMRDGVKLHTVILVPRGA